MGDVYDLAVRNDQIAVGTTSVFVSPARFRSEFSFVNSGTTNITLSLGTAAVSKTGIYLLPGGTYSDSRARGFDLFNTELYAISDAAGGVLSVMER